MEDHRICKTRMNSDLVTRVYRLDGSPAYCYRVLPADYVQYGGESNNFDDGGLHAGYLVDLVAKDHQRCKCMSSVPVLWFVVHQPSWGQWPLHFLASQVISRMLADKYRAVVRSESYGFCFRERPLPPLPDQ